VDQKFPNRDDDKSDAILDDAGFADFFLFHHAILLRLTAAAILLVTLAAAED